MMNPSVPTHPARLRAGALHTLQVTATSLANIAPAYSLFTTLGVIVLAAGLASPLMLILAGVAMVFHVNSTSQFSRHLPSAGTYTTWIARTLRQQTGATAGVLFAFAGIMLLTSVYVVAGWWPSVMIQALWGVSIPAWLPLLVFCSLGIGLCIRGVVISTQWAIALFVFEVAVLMVSSIVMLATHASAITAADFDPRNITGGFAGVGLAFPLAVYPYLGSSNSAPMAEETKNPKRAITRAVYTTVLAGIFIYTFCTWATVVGFDDHLSPLTHATFPMVTAGSRALGPAGFLMYFAGLTSTLALVIVDTNAFTRLWFNLGRDGLFPDAFTRVHGRFHTPIGSIAIGGGVVLGLGLVLDVVYGPVNAFDYSGTIGTISVIVVFMVVNLSLPIYFWRNLRPQFSIVWHAIVPILGIAIFAVPLASSVSLSQPAPYNYFGPLVLAVIVVGAVGVAVTRRRRPQRLRVGHHVVEEVLDDLAAFEPGVSQGASAL